MIKKIVNFIKVRDDLYEEISNIIDYGGNLTDNELFLYTDEKFSIHGEDLFIYDIDDDEWYSLIISSLGTMGEKLYIGESDGYVYVMAYEDERGWDNTNIYIFDADKRTDDIN